MKLFFASDIHGDLAAATAMREAFLREGAGRLFLLGDILYHGPRNDLPTAYAPKEVAALLGEMKDKILAVRGNCDTEVDQMMLPFPILADYAALPLQSGQVVYLTHGHHALPPLSARDLTVQGHTHVAGKTVTPCGHVCLNPGSVSIPKGGTPPAYMIYENGIFSIRRLDGGEEIERYVLGE